MARDTLHELHHRRAGRNFGLLAALVALIVIVFGLAVVKIRQGGMMEGFDHQPRASMLPRDPDARPRIPEETTSNAPDETETTP